MPLTTPSDDALDLSARLQELIRREIQANGPISFARYMELALYAPGLGYYNAGLHKFGRAGDFVTAPELGPVFAQSIAFSLADFLRVDVSRCVFEIGAGSGALARDLLQQLDALDALPAHYFILERSGDLRQRQQQSLAALPPEILARVIWLDAPPTQSWTGVLLANEVIDALPFERFRRRDGDLLRAFVAIENAHFIERWLPVDAAIFDDIAALNIPPDLDVEFEHWPQLAAWLHGLTQNMQHGLAVLIDYGETGEARYAGARSGGTMRCFYRQQLHNDPYWHPGLSDITADVDFSALARAGEAAGLAPQGFCSQATFLLQGGLPQVFANMAAMDVRAQLNLSAQIKTLTLPSSMGERFKVMCFSRGLAPTDIPEIFSAN
jgi:SAM-dependent MidA family methyltransferase